MWAATRGANVAPAWLVVNAFRRAAIPLLALAAVSLSPSAAGADSINLLRQGSPRLSPSIIIDRSSSTIGATSDENTDGLDRDCVAIDDDVRGSWSRFGRVEFRFGRFAWEWDPQTGPDIVYVICVERSDAGPGGGGGSSMGGAMMMLAAGAWANRAVQTAQPMAADPGVIASLDEPLIASDLALEPAADQSPERHDPSIDNTRGTWSDVEPLITVAVGPHSALLEPFLAAGLLATFETPVTAPVPAHAAPVPEPTTLLLFGTGLAAAWRARRKKTED